MVKTICILLFYSFFVFQTYSQSDRTLRWFLTATYTPQDLFAGAGFSKAFQSGITLQSMLSVGVNRTFFQQRPYPKLGGQITYTCFKTDGFWVQLGLRGTSDLLHINKAIQYGYVFGEELLPVMNLVVGNRWRGSLSTGIGRRWEWYHSMEKSRYTSIHSWNYFFELSLSHVLR